MNTNAERSSGEEKRRNQVLATEKSTFWRGRMGGGCGGTGLQRDFWFGGTDEVPQGFSRGARLGMRDSAPVPIAKWNLVECVEWRGFFDGMRWNGRVAFG
jgi:hypothetical protein